MQFKSEDDIVSFAITAKLPEWQGKLFKQNREAVQVHSQGQLFYKIDRLFPNEHSESKKHRVLSFESITEPSFDKAANNINRIFKNSSYTVEASEKTLQFAREDGFEGQNLFNWFLDNWTKWALKEDPNSRIVVYPLEYATEKGIHPIVFVPSDRIKFIDAETFVFISDESDITVQLQETRLSREVFLDQTLGGKMNARTIAENTFTPVLVETITRYVYHVFQKGEGIYRIEQTKQGNTTDWTIELIKINSKDFLPVTEVGGSKGRYQIYKSFLHAFVPFANLALLQHSQHTAVNFTFSFPRMSEIQTPCSNPHCREGYVYLDDKDETKEKCKTCNGSAYTTNQTPYKVYTKRYDPQGVDGGDKYLEVPDVQFYTPDTAILDYSKNEWKDYLAMAEKAVYIQQKVETGNVESAKSKDLDREDFYSFLSKIGHTYYGKLRFVLQCLENEISSQKNQVGVNEPFSFAILTEGEAFDALQKILGSSVPVMIKANQVDAFINKFVSQSSPIRKFIDVLKLVDPLLYYSPAEITSFRTTGAVLDEAVSIHVFAFPVLQQMFFKDTELSLQDAESIANKLTTELAQYKPKPVQTIKDKFQQQQQQP